MRLTPIERTHAICAFVVPIVLVLFAFVSTPQHDQRATSTALSEGCNRQAAGEAGEPQPGCTEPVPVETVSAARLALTFGGHAD